MERNDGEEDGFVSRFYDSTKRIRNIAEELVQFSSAFDFLRQERLSSDLDHMAGALINAAEQIEETVGIVVKDGLESSQKMHNAILQTVFAGIEIGREQQHGFDK